MKGSGISGKPCAKESELDASAIAIGGSGANRVLRQPFLVGTSAWLFALWAQPYFFLTQQLSRSTTSRHHSFSHGCPFGIDTMVSFNHIEVRVKCRDQAATENEQIATEHEDDERPDDGSNIICRYIEVQANQFWQVKIKVGRRFDWQDADLVVVRLFLDGKYTGGQCLRKPKTPGADSVKGRLYGTWSESSKFLLFKFADLETRKPFFHAMHHL